DICVATAAGDRLTDAIPARRDTAWTATAGAAIAAAAAGRGQSRRHRAVTRRRTRGVDRRGTAGGARGPRGADRAADVHRLRDVAETGRRHVTDDIDAEAVDLGDR